jgi:hypothetical protein
VVKKIIKEIVISSPKCLEDAEDDLQELKVKILRHMLIEGNKGHRKRGNDSERNIK